MNTHGVSRTKQKSGLDDRDVCVGTENFYSFLQLAFTIIPKKKKKNGK